VATFVIFERWFLVPLPKGRSKPGWVTEMGFENIILGFHIAITPFNLLVAVVGITLGTIIGVLPGLGGAKRRGHPAPADVPHAADVGDHPAHLALLGALFGGAITSVALQHPGEPWSVATTFDGYRWPGRARGPRR